MNEGRVEGGEMVVVGYKGEFGRVKKQPRCQRKPSMTNYTRPGDERSAQFLWIEPLDDTGVGEPETVPESLEMDSGEAVFPIRGTPAVTLGTSPSWWDCEK